MTAEPIIDGAEAGAGVAVVPRVFPRAEACARLKALIEAGGRAGLMRGQWGLEREGLRVEADGQPALTPHPFGPEERAITVDFAEAQVELCIIQVMLLLLEARIKFKLEQVEALGQEMLKVAAMAALVVTVGLML